MRASQLAAPDASTSDATGGPAPGRTTRSSSLPGPVRAKFERSLGADLSAVRVHTDDASASAAAGVGAQAFAVGNDIHFGAGRYQPDDPFGLHLLAHEVAHTQQQAGGSPAPQHKLEVSEPGDPAEHEADRAASAMVRGEPASVSSIAVGIHRAPDPAYQKPTKISGSLNWSATINWDDPPQLYAIAGDNTKTLRDLYQQHLLERIKADPEISGMTFDDLKKKAATDDKYRVALWRASQRAIVDTLQTENSRRYQAEDRPIPDDPYESTYKETFCNVYSADMVNAMGGYLPRVWYFDLGDPDKNSKATQDALGKGKGELNANQIGAWLNKWGYEFGWRGTMDATEAQMAANSGRVVIAQASKTNAAAAGHVNVILAEGAGHKAKATQPLQSQAGVTNYGFSDTAAKTNSDDWWKASEMKKPNPDKGQGYFWIYVGPHMATAVASELDTGGKFGK